MVLSIRLWLPLSLMVVCACGAFSERLDGEVIGPEGGEIRTATAALTIPPSAMSGPVLAAIEPLAATSVPDGLRARALEQTAHEAIPTDLRFDPPATVTLHIDPVDLEALAPGVQARNLRIIRYDEATDSTSIVPGAIEPTLGAVHGVVDRLGLFAIAPECDAAVATASCGPDRLCVAGGCVARTAIHGCGDGVDNDGDGTIDEGCPE